MHDLVKDYYANQLKSSADLRTSACCDASRMPDWLKPLLARIHPEVMSRYYGCGLVCPAGLDGLSVLDLGCGSGGDGGSLHRLFPSFQSAPVALHGGGGDRAAAGLVSCVRWAVHAHPLLGWLGV